MQQSAVDLLARALGVSRSRRKALIFIGAIVIGADSTAARRRTNSGQRRSTRRTPSSQACTQFVIAAGPHKNDRFQHTDDDLRIEIIPTGGGAAKTVFDDNNNAPNGPNGDHLRVPPFTARVGDQVHIVASNDVAGGCELDEIWLHCVEGQGGKMKLADGVSRTQCQGNANRIGVFFETTVRIKNL